MAFTDRYGLTVTTDSSVAFERFQEGMDHLLAYGPEGETRLAQAVEADPGLAVAHTGRALLALVAGDAAAARCRGTGPPSQRLRPPTRAA
jgi:hypothetical protein